MNFIALVSYYTLVIAAVVVLALLGVGAGLVTVVAAVGILLSILVTGVYLRTQDQIK